VSTTPGEVITILFADIGGSVRLYQELGDVEGHRHVTESLERMAVAIKKEGGVLLRTVGDESLARFDDPNMAVRAAIAIQQAHQSSPLSVRVGFHHGPVIEDRGDVYGNAVNIAARIASFARVTEITTTGESVNHLFSEHRQRATLLKTSAVRGLDDSINIFRIDWQSGLESATRIATRVATPNEQRAATCTRQLHVQFQQNVFTLGAQRSVLTIGRTELADVCVLTDRASREHALLELRDGQFTLTDTSTNGTYIRKDGQPVIAVQRETVILDGRGLIGVGIDPGDPASNAAAVAAGSDPDLALATLDFSIAFD